MKPGTWTFTGWALAVSALLGVALVGLILHLNSRAEDQRGLYATARADYDTLEKLRLRYRDLEVRKRNMPVNPGSDGSSWQAYLSQRAQEAGLPTPSISPELSQRGALKESAYTVTLDAAAGATIPRQRFIRFLDQVERQRPGFKSKTVALTFSKNAPDEFSRATATFSHFER
jgi:hypothetical protein